VSLKLRSIMSGTTAPLGWFWTLSLNFFPYKQLKIVRT
jgi:hypothetical protein